MTNNRWTDHVRKTAQENGISYACALSIASKTYQKVTKEDKKEKDKKLEEATMKSASNALYKRIQKMAEGDIPLVKTQFLRKSKPYKQHFIDTFPQSFKKLFNEAERKQIMEDLK